MASRATLRDVAEVAGVSTAAVSKVVRDAYGVSPAMRERVTAAIDELGYRPNISARAMRGASSTIGVELAGIGNPFFTLVLDAAMSALTEARYQVMIAPAQSETYEGRAALEALADHNVAAALAVSPVVGQEWLERFARAMPLVILGRHLTGENFDSITGDDVDGTRQVMSHLFQGGHRRIAHLTRSEAVTDAASGSPHARRLEGYLRAMSVAGFDDDVLVARSGPSEAEAFAATSALLTGGRRPSAIFAANDELAFGALRAIRTAGLTTDDVALVGYDDVPLAQLPGISLTSVNQNGPLMGARAAQLLLERLDGRREAVHEVLPVQLSIRETSRRPS